MEPEEPKAPEGSAASGLVQNDAPPAGRRNRNLFRYVLLPLAALALVAFMIFGVANLGASSPAVQELQAQPSPTAADTASPTASGAAPADTPGSVAPTAPTPPAASPTPEPSGPEPAAPSALQGVAPTRITVPAAGVDVQVLPLIPNADEVAAQSIVPPATDDGYWLTSYGAPGAGSTDTTYIAGHSWEGREAPFDLFSTNVHPGDIITLGTARGPLTYIVDAVTTHDKESLKNSDIWDIAPNRLVIISCFTEDPWGKNVIVTASPAK